MSATTGTEAMMSTKNPREAILLLSIAEVIEMAIEELVRLATDLVKPFIDDPRCSGARLCMPEVNTFLSDLRRFARSLELKALGLDHGGILSLAQFALRDRTSVQSSTWTSEPSTLQADHARIAAWDSVDYPGFSYVLQLKFLVEQTNFISQDAERFFLYRENFLFATTELFHRLPIEVPAAIKLSQMFVPCRLYQVPAIAVRLSQWKTPDLLGRTMSHILYDAGSSQRWSAAEINIPDYLGRTAIYLACRDGKREVVRHLIAAGAAVDFQAANGLWPLDIAAISGDPRICSMIWNEEAQESIDMRYESRLNSFRRSPLMWAAFFGNGSSVRFFRNYSGTHRNATALVDEYQCSAVGLAAMRGHCNLVRYLSEIGCSCDIADRSGRSPFWYAAANSQRQVMKLLHKIVCVDRADNEGFTPLAIAAKRGHADIVSEMVNPNGPYAAAINVCAPTFSGDTPLHLAASNRHWKCVDILLARGIRTNVQLLLHRGMSAADAEHIEAYAKADYHRAFKKVQESGCDDGCKVFSDHWGSNLLSWNR